MSNSRATLVADLGFGDAGKGSVVDYLVRQQPRASVVVRYNGGPQAAHNVITPSGQHHTFAQFGSGSLVPGTRTHLSRSMLINPLNAFNEADHLLDLGVHDIWLRTTFDADAMVITPFHVAMNHLREIARGDGRHGSCGQGVGETRALDKERPWSTIRIRDLFDANQLRTRLEYVRGLLHMTMLRLHREVPPSEVTRQATNVLAGVAVVDQLVAAYQQFLQVARVADTDDFSRLVRAKEHLVFEGAQGVLLDEKYGFHPHTTWSDITFNHAQSLLTDIGFRGDVQRLGLIRGYATRHGAGPFVTEDKRLTQLVPDKHNGHNRWQHGFRVGHPDVVASRYAIKAVGGVDALAVTNLDRMVDADGWKLAVRYQAPRGVVDRGDVFTVDGDGVVDINHRTGKDLDRQQVITNALLKSSPVYQELQTASGGGKLVTEEDFEMYLERLSRELSTPITLTSFGPTATDKRPYSRVLT